MSLKEKLVGSKRLFADDAFLVPYGTISSTSSIGGRCGMAASISDRLMEEDRRRAPVEEVLREDPRREQKDRSWAESLPSAGDSVLAP